MEIVCLDHRIRASALDRWQNSALVLYHGLAIVTVDHCIISLERFPLWCPIASLGDGNVVEQYKKFVSEVLYRYSFHFGPPIRIVIVNPARKRVGTMTFFQFEAVRGYGVTSEQPPSDKGRKAYSAGIVATSLK